MKKALVILPTYNEIENLPVIVDEIFSNTDKNSCGVNFDILIVDSNSPDGTRKWAEERSQSDDRVFFILREQKDGLALACFDGFQWGYAKNYDYIFQMDADLSHDPKYISPMLEMLISEHLNCVIGSRFYKRTVSVINWPLERMFLSLLGMAYLYFILRIPVRDVTTGFKVYNKNATQVIVEKQLSSRGYVFQAEILYRLHKRGMKMEEYPIIFIDRGYGKSKMSKSIIIEALIVPWKLRIKSIFGSS